MAADIPRLSLDNREIVLAWLQAKGTYQLERSLVDVAQAARQINLARETRQAPPLPADIVAMLH